jgi:hypothetical protein
MVFHYLFVILVFFFLQLIRLTKYNLSKLKIVIFYKNINRRKFKTRDK